MTASQLHAFLALADAGSFRRRSAATGLSQPALHRAVRDLEQICAVAAGRARGRGVALTPRDGGSRAAYGSRRRDRRRHGRDRDRRLPTRQHHRRRDAAVPRADPARRHRRLRPHGCPAC
jgi:hypothetical protein